MQVHSNVVRQLSILTVFSIYVNLKKYNARVHESNLSDNNWKNNK